MTRLAYLLGRLRAKLDRRQFSRPFTIHGCTYVVDLGTGREYFYSLNTMRITGERTRRAA